MLPIALDAMGGDKAPEAILEGARRAVDELQIPLLLVGRPDSLSSFTAPNVEILSATETIDMDEDPAGAVRRKKDSSLVRAAEAVRDGSASAMVSAGNTGAAMASALLRMGRIEGVSRPAVASVIPVVGSTPTILLDAGANSECVAPWLAQFARMGSVFATERYEIEKPKIGLLSIGEEAGKGTDLVKETHNLLEQDQSVNFIGNVEGRDILSNDVDVVVTDGFTGNVVLKTLEGTSKFLMNALMNAMNSTEEARAAGEKLMPALLPLAEQIDPDSYGGAMLLGVNGVCIISHGSSGPKAIFNALRTSKEMVEHDLVGKLAKAVAA